MADYEYDTLKPLGGVLVNPYAIAAKKRKQAEVIKKEKILQISEGAFICPTNILETPELLEWLSANRFKTIIQDVSSEDCRGFGSWNLKRISFTDRKTTLLFKLSNETVRI